MNVAVILDLYVLTWIKLLSSIFLQVIFSTLWNGTLSTNKDMSTNLMSFSSFQPGLVALLSRPPEICVPAQNRTAKAGGYCCTRLACNLGTAAWSVCRRQRQDLIIMQRPGNKPVLFPEPLLAHCFQYSKTKGKAWEVVSGRQKVDTPSLCCFHPRVT